MGDGYIFLQYARNLASGNGWAINPGETSFATTAPAWTILLALVHCLSPTHSFVLSQVLGLLFFSGALVVFFGVLKKSVPRTPQIAILGLTVVALIPFNGLFYAISAMETGLYLLLFMAFAWIVQRNSRSLGSNVTLGVLTGLLFLTRPESALCAVCYVALDWKHPGRLVQTTAQVMGPALMVALPWEVFLYLNSGYLLPTSGSGRLYGYLSSVFPNLPLGTYVGMSLPAKISLIPTAIQTQFVDHPVMFTFCLVPYVVLCLLVGADAIEGQTDRVSAFLLLYCSMLLATYLLLQPLVFQRYFVVLFPASVACAIRRLATLRRGMLLAVVIGMGVVIVSTNILAINYYRDHIELDAETVRLVRAVPVSHASECRLAAEPLGYAAYFTSCYVIDLGGLINPDLWDYWRDGKTNLEYAIDKRATFVVAGEGLPSSHFLLLHREKDRALYAVRP